MAEDITALLGNSYPLVLSVMGGAVGSPASCCRAWRFRWILTMCMCRATATKPVAASWCGVRPPRRRARPRGAGAGRYSDEGETMAAIRDKVLAMA